MINLSLSSSLISLELISSCFEMKEIDSVKLSGIDCWLKICEAPKFSFRVIFRKSPLWFIKANWIPLFESNSIWLSGFDADVEAISNFAFIISFFIYIKCIIQCHCMLFKFSKSKSQELWNRNWILDDISLITSFHSSMGFHCQFATKRLWRTASNRKSKNSVFIKIWKGFTIFIHIRFNSLTCNTNEFMRVTNFPISKKKNLFYSIFTSR